ncbi:MAG: PAS domain S-box protein, partial [Armatimonadetes bacterium]|nr:PAS domain S-box protein [Armatimonadota bacterium]
MKPRVTNPVVLLAIILLIASIFILDELTPLGVAEWLLYLLPLLFSTRSASRRYPVIVASVCTAMIALGFFLSPPGISVQLAVFNRSMGIFVLWVTALLLERRQRAEAALRRERNLLARITETSPVAITVVDREGQITFANRRAEEVLGL